MVDCAEEPLSMYYQKKATKIIKSLRNNTFPDYKQYSDYKRYSNRTLLNLSFRNGGELHTQWTNNDEVYILSFLVHTGDKPVASLVPWTNQGNTKETANQLREQVEMLCEANRWYRVKTKVMFNKWNVYVVVLFQQRNNSSDIITNGVGSISNDTIGRIVNETASWDDMGKFYGYNDELYDNTDIIGPIAKDDITEMLSEMLYKLKIKQESEN